VDVSFNGLDVPPLPSVSDFVKALSIDHGRDGEVMIAYAMNDQPLPMVNGFPLRLVVPGWYGTYWVKALSDITVLAHPSATSGRTRPTAFPTLQMARVSKGFGQGHSSY